ncbi:hypothetical protein GY45DRAFT_1256970 [Cubamyces sp. BRFM 1775]|nr:hypothetical protein GY45DRAFT_1256970 [Cubamyces sp. BRFM 1775]
MSTPSPQRLPGKVITKFRPPHELLARDDVALPQLYDWNAQHNAEYPLFVFHDGERLVHITYHAANQAIDRSASLILQKHGPSSAHGSKQPVIGLFADSDAVSYVCTAIGVMRAGYVAFFISIKNGPAAIADMLRRTNATALLPVLGVVLATFKPQSPPTVPSPDAVWNGMVSTRSDFTWGVPSFIEQWSREPKKIAVMKQMRGIMFGGAPLRKDVGDALASQGVSIYNAYGS